MVYIIDVCKAWVHEECSTGMANLIEEVFPQEKIVLYAEKEHIRAMREVGLAKRIKARAVSYSDKTTLKVMSLPYYMQLSRILEKVKSGDFVFCLASEKAIMEAMYRIAGKQKGVKFFMVVHGTMEDILIPNGGIRGIRWEELSRKKGWNKKAIYLDDHIFPLEKTIARSVKYPNVKFITYGPCAIQEFSKIFDNKVLQKFIFLNIPLVPDKCTGVRNETNKVRIGIWGNCLNGKFDKVISYVNKNSDTASGGIDTNRYEFVILKSKKSSTLPKLKNTKIYESTGQGFTREQMKELIQGMDFALIPYDRDKYRVSCSGILADAISNRIPIMALECAPCRYYHEKYDIGYVEKTIGELGKRIIEAIKEKRTFSVMDTLAEVLHQENLEKMRAEINEGQNS